MDEKDKKDAGDKGKTCIFEAPYQIQVYGSTLGRWSAVIIKQATTTYGLGFPPLRAEEILASVAKVLRRPITSEMWLCKKANVYGVLRTGVFSYIPCYAPNR